jgi:hypothetical protein
MLRIAAYIGDKVSHVLYYDGDSEDLIVMTLRCNWINQNGVQCGQPMGHITGHGNGSLTSATDTWHEYFGPIKIIKTLPKVEKSGTVWTEKSTKPRCQWSGTHSLCIYEVGHTIGHKEEAVQP